MTVHSVVNLIQAAADRSPDHPALRYVVRDGEKDPLPCAEPPGESSIARGEQNHLAVSASPTSTTSGTSSSSSSKRPSSSSTYSYRIRNLSYAPFWTSCQRVADFLKSSCTRIPPEQAVERVLQQREVGAALEDGPSRCNRKHDTRCQKIALVAIPDCGPVLSIAQVAVLHAEMILVHADPGDPRFFDIVQDCAPDFLLVAGWDGVVPRDTKSKSPNSPFSRLLVEKTNTKIVDVSGVLLAPAQEQLESPTGSDLHAEQDHVVLTPVHKKNAMSQDLFSHIYYTSGSTGKPKGCLLRQSAVLNYSLAKNHVHEVDNSAVVLLLSSCTFDPHLGDTLATLAAGGTLVVPRKNVAESFLAGGDSDFMPSRPGQDGGVTKTLAGSSSASNAKKNGEKNYVTRTPLLTKFEEVILSGCKVTHCQTTPSLWQSLVGGTTSIASGILDTTCEQDDQRTAYQLHTLALGGESMARFWPINGCYKNLLNTYGVTECYCYQTFKRVERLRDTGFIGEPFPGNAVELWERQDDVDDEDAKNASSTDGDRLKSSRSPFVRRSMMNNNRLKIAKEQAESHTKNSLSIGPRSCSDAEEKTAENLQKASLPSPRLEIVIGGKQVGEYFRPEVLQPTTEGEEEPQSQSQPCGREEATSSSDFLDMMDKSLFYRTGDAGERVEVVDDNDGDHYTDFARKGKAVKSEIRIRGRLDWQVKLGGVRVELEEIEARLAKSTVLTKLFKLLTCVVVPTEGVSTRTLPAASATTIGSGGGANAVQPSTASVSSPGAGDYTLALCLTLQPGAADPSTKNDFDSQDRSPSGVLAASSRFQDLLSHVVRTEAGKNLPAKWIPKAIFLLDAMPVTSNGKVDRKGLQKKVVERRQNSSTASLPTETGRCWPNDLPSRDGEQEDQSDENASDIAHHDGDNLSKTKTERLIATIWKEELGVFSIHREDNFFLLGGDSLAALRVCRRIIGLVCPVKDGQEEENVVDEFGTIFQKELTVKFLCENPVLREYAKRLEGVLVARGEEGRDGELDETNQAENRAEMRELLAGMSKEQQQTEAGTASIKKAPSKTRPAVANNDHVTSWLSSPRKDELLQTAVYFNLTNFVEALLEQEEKQDADNSQRPGSVAAHAHLPETLPANTATSCTSYDTATKRIEATPAPSTSATTLTPPSTTRPTFFPKTRAASETVAAETERTEVVPPPPPPASRRLKREPSTTPLHVAAQQGYREIVRVLLADPRTKKMRTHVDKNGALPLHFSADKEILRDLLVEDSTAAVAATPRSAINRHPDRDHEKSSHPTEQGKTGEKAKVQTSTPPPSKTSLLTARDKNRQTLLHFLARRGDAETLEAVLFGDHNRQMAGGKNIIASPAATVATSSLKKTAPAAALAAPSLQLPSKVNPSDEVVDDADPLLWPEKTLHYFTSRVDWRDKWHRTPLSWAILNHQEACVRLLLKAGACVHGKIKDRKHAKESHLVNESPAELAERVGFDLEKVMLEMRL
ncbi:unnamed protein product [Amoebophrya sp. A120]|nr:unnamed protein product [Amoebophrya sp. A120]|eukprot:GSA120T00018162001.1